MLHYNHSSISVFRFLLCLLILFFIGIQPIWAAVDDCTIPNVFCRGPEVGPFIYGTGYGGYAASAQGAADNTCNHWLESGSICKCEVKHVSQFVEVSYQGISPIVNGGHEIYFTNGGVEWWQIFQGTVPGATYKRHKWFWDPVNGTECKPLDEPATQLLRNRSVYCPKGFRWNNSTEPTGTYCYINILEKPIQDNTCKVGNPISIASGNKQQTETDYQSTTLRFIRTYNSDTTNTANGETMGSHWRHNYDRYLSIPSNAVNVSGSAYALRQNGITDHFVLEDGVVTEATMISARLEQVEAGWHYITTSDETELYDNNGRLVSITEKTGRTKSFTYDNTGRLTEVSDDSGRTLTFTYDSEDRIDTMTDPEGGVYTYEYDSNSNLSKVIYPDATPDDLTDNPAKTYHYEDARFPNALTGITDENNNRYATWEYDEEGRAISSEHAGGTERTIFNFNEDGSTTITNALGKQTTYRFADIRGYRYVASVEGHQTDYCAGANKSYNYDANGNVTSKTDWNGVTTTYTYDMARNLELTRTEAVGTPQERTITTEWHTDFRLPTKIIEPGRITEYTYDANGLKQSSKVKSIQ